MTHIHKRPRKIASLKADIISAATGGDNTLTELVEASSLAIIDRFHWIEREYKIPCPTCPKPKEKKRRKNKP